MDVDRCRFFIVTGRLVVQQGWHAPGFYSGTTFHKRPHTRRCVAAGHFQGSRASISLMEVALGRWVNTLHKYA